MAFVSAISDPHFFHTCNKVRILHQNPRFPLSSLKSQRFQNPRSPSLVFSASGGGANGNGEVKPEAEAGGGGPGELRRDRRPSFNIRWRDLLDPDPENILAVGLTGLLTWASFQVLLQLFFITFAIVLAALKYSLIAALLLFILITLL